MATEYFRGRVQGLRESQANHRKRFHEERTTFNKRLNQMDLLHRQAQRCVVLTVLHMHAPDDRSVKNKLNYAYATYARMIKTAQIEGELVLETLVEQEPLFLEKPEAFAMVARFLGIDEPR